MKVTYWKRLRHHPGVPIASVFTVAGALAGGVQGTLIASLIWIPVLITARTQPVPEDE